MGSHAEISQGLRSRSIVLLSMGMRYSLAALQTGLFILRKASRHNVLFVKGLPRSWSRGKCKEPYWPTEEVSETRYQDFGFSIINIIFKVVVPWGQEKSPNLSTKFITQLLI